MDDKQTKSLQERTDAKLRYARVHLDELKSQGPPSGNDFDKAHQESFLFHLLGARDAFLAELNHYCQARVPSDALSLGRIRDALKKQGTTSPELSTLYKLEQDESSWFCKAKEMRDHSTHVQGVPRVYYLGGENHQKVKLKSPRTGTLTERHFIIEFDDWLYTMEELVLSLRESALSNMRPESPTTE
jgi:hypothetical protein